MLSLLPALALFNAVGSYTRQFELAMVRFKPNGDCTDLIVRAIQYRLQATRACAPQTIVLVAIFRDRARIDLWIRLHGVDQNEK